MNDFKITALNFDIQWKSPLDNFSKIEDSLKGIDANLFLLPEMFSTGFYMKPEEIADEQEKTLQWMKVLAKNKNAAIGGSVSVKEGNNYYNRFYFVKPCGDYHFYDKRHLFSYSGEDKVYSKGNDRVIVEYEGVRFLLQICYDLRFPVFSRNKGDYDMALYVANWPIQRIDAWNTLLKARAIENQAYVFGVNRVGTDGNGLEYPESTHCFFPDGREVSYKKGDLVEVVLDMESLNKFRTKFPFLGDADDFKVSL
ncbi:amidohydrolase [Riemerella anatipestifer]|uniref:Omega-amidase YafV n=1 Tax=Riemerella anatipestifer RA-CH-1 TaxID=1228997 RepID=J9QT18_RIEAN|nr:amidohydrolase [Riemerella anatipestifer]AFR35241.1 putative amidohydrolase [Riemerella anatipestifer RA-CH-1]AIH02261.1 nitrilase/cyanide hydratase and apolipoprotein n-acyltransferase [Riemerella anatipestifer CH3]MCO7332329.1 amidohydrolase [Riemerella anatipestifer]MCO7351305.1 amidohydrolase [Riemerella anatipestifer]MCU7582829.1 amidohydrolase [Riemerella anatipestifer]